VWASNEFSTEVGSTRSKGEVYSSERRRCSGDGDSLDVSCRYW